MPETYDIRTVRSASPLDLEAIFRAASRGTRVERRVSELERVAICARIKQARLEAGLTQEEMADLLHVRQRTIHNYETDRVPWRLIGKIAEVTGKTNEWLLHGEPGEATHSVSAGEVAELREAIEEVRRENLEAQQQTLQLLEEVRSLLRQQRSA